MTRSTVATPPDARGPVLTAVEVDHIVNAQRRGETSARVSLDLGRSQTSVDVTEHGFRNAGIEYRLPERPKERTVYAIIDGRFEPVARYSQALYKLVPTEWGPPTFEIDGIKMLPSARVSPMADAIAKVALVAPAGRRLLDTCGGLGYFAAAALEAGAREIVSFEKSADVLWLRTHNPWSPTAGGRLSVTHADVVTSLATLPDRSFEAILHDPPRFGIAGELYAGTFYDELARLLTRGGRLFHYTGTPNRLTSGRDVPGEVLKRLTAAGFKAERAKDGILATRR